MIVREPVVDYGTFIRLYKWSLDQYTLSLEREQYQFPDTFFSDLRFYCHVTITEILFVLVAAVIFTKLRIYLTKTVFLPFALSMRTPRPLIHKIPENLWKLGFYCCTTLWSFYVVLGRHPHWFADPLSLWNEWQPHCTIPWDVYVAYIVQCGFYLHSVYATIYLDPKRKDFWVMMTHHGITLSLISFSYVTRHYMEGALVLFCHDVNDIFLELWKLNSNWRRRAQNKFYKFHDNAAIVSFALFVSTWFWFRLYWYPLKVMYTAAYGPFVMLPQRRTFPFWLIFNALLTVLLALNVYWFALMIIGIFRHVVVRDIQEVGDTREYSIQKNSRLSLSADELLDQID